MSNPQPVKIKPETLEKIKRNIPRALIGFMALWFFFSSWYTIDPEEAGVVQRFGKYIKTVQPGLHFKFPFSVDQVTKVPVERQLKAEFGFRTMETGSRSQYSTDGYTSESMMLTGDLNLANVEWVVQYRIKDPYKYLFLLKHPEATLNYMSEAVMRSIVGDRTVNEVLTVGRQEVANSAEILLQQLCDDYQSGIKIEQIVLQDVNPPDEVKPSFNGVNEAQQEKEKLINEALANFNKVVPKAKGQALETIQNAEGYAVDRVNRAKGEAARFNALYEQYAKAPEITRKRIYLETMEKIIPKLGNKIVTDEKGANILPLLQLQAQNSVKENGGER